MDREFERAGRMLSNGLHMDYWRANAERDAIEVKAELIVLTGHADAMRALESISQAEFDRLFGAHRQTVAGLGEQRRQHYERLRLATAQPQAIEWGLPETIPFRRTKLAKAFDKHLYVENNGEFRADLGP